MASRRHGESLAATAGRYAGTDAADRRDSALVGEEPKGTLHEADSATDIDHHLSMAAVIALSGCGGSGVAMAPTTPTDSLEPAAGLIPSTANAVYATDAADTLAAQLPDATRTFAPLTAGLLRQSEQNGPRSTTLSKFRVDEIPSDGNNGFHVTWTDGDETRTVHMTSEDYDDDYGAYLKRNDDGEYWFWSWTGSFDGTDKNSGSSQ